MTPEDLCNLAKTVIEDMKGTEIVVMDVRTLTSMTDYMIMSTGRSTRHIKAIADSVAIKAKEKKVTHVRIEGDRESEWVLVDLGDVVVHVMSANARSFYSLEDLWEPIKELRDQKNA